MSLNIYAFPPSPYSRSLLFFLEHAGIGYELVTVNLRSGENKSDGYQMISPSQKTPAIKLGDFTMGETSSIMRFLADKYGKWVYYPQELERRAQVDYWMEFVCQNVIPFSRELVWQRHLFPAVGRKHSADLEERASQAIDRNLLVLDARLLRNKYICGSEISLADFLFTPSIEWHVDAKIDLTDFGGICDWHDRMKSEPSWHRVESILKNFFSKQNISNSEFEYAK